MRKVTAFGPALGAMTLMLTAAGAFGRRHRDDQGREFPEPALAPARATACADKAFSNEIAAGGRSMGVRAGLLRPAVPFYRPSHPSGPPHAAEAKRARRRARNLRLVARGGIESVS